MIILLWWIALFAGFSAAIPFAAERNGPYSDAYFEAIAARYHNRRMALIQEGAVENRRHCMLWRAELQWLGGSGVDCCGGRNFHPPGLYRHRYAVAAIFARRQKFDFSAPVAQCGLQLLLVDLRCRNHFHRLCGISRLAGAPTLDAVVMALSGVASVADFIANGRGRCGLRLVALVGCLFVSD